MEEPPGTLAARLVDSRRASRIPGLYGVEKPAPCWQGCALPTLREAAASFEWVPALPRAARLGSRTSDRNAAQ
jgi:hypothetical protein